MRLYWSVAWGLSLVACDATSEAPPPDAGGPLADSGGISSDAGILPDLGLPRDSGAEGDAGTCPPCGADQRCVAGACVACSGEPGLLRDQSIEVEGADRRYLLYVPAAYRCEEAWPLWVDLHGAYGGDQPAEEVYTLEGAMEAADREGFILVRPRSRTIPRDGRAWHYWDANSGDVTGNQHFIEALAASIEARYHLDSNRQVITGFSNGTQPALRAWADPQTRFTGVGVIGGGYWTPFPLPSDQSDAPRLYVATGYRDLHHNLGVDPLEAAIDRTQYPRARYRKREALHGHVLLPWHYADAAAWLLRAEPPPSGPLGPGLRLEATLGETILVVTASTAGGPRFLGGARGGVWIEDHEGRRALPSIPATPGGPRPVTGLCTTPDGGLVAAAGAVLGRLEPGASIWTLLPLPPSPEAYVGLVLDVACGPDGVVLAAGVSGYRSTDQGRSYQPLFLGFPLYGAAQINRIARTESGRYLAAGEYFLAASEDGLQFTVLDGASPYYALHVDGERAWVAGPGGQVWTSSGPGQAFTPLPASSPAVDLYDLIALSDGRLIGVGGNGALAIFNGASWQTIATGSDALWSGIRRVTEDQLFVYGEEGRILSLTAP